LINVLLEIHHEAIGKFLSQRYGASLPNWSRGCKAKVWCVAKHEKMHQYTFGKS
jgi:hypothetical protein